MSDFKITVRPNGSYKILGPLVIVDPTGQEFNVPEGKAVALCRCGHSSDKPFCDGTHKEIGFKAEEAASPRDFD